MSIKLPGATSGSIDIDVPAVVGGDVSLVLPGGGIVDRLERAGNILQVVNVQDGVYASGTGTISLGSAIPQNTDGTEFMTLAITPTSAASKLLITVNALLVPESGDWVIGALFQDSGVNAIATWAVYQHIANATANSNFSHYMTAGTTSETTFKFRAGRNSAGTIKFNGSTNPAWFGNTAASSITITEIAA